MSLDDQIKSKLTEREFEFKEEYWQAASALIDNHQRRKSLKRLLFLLGGGSAALALLLYFTIGHEGTETLLVNQKQSYTHKTSESISRNEEYTNAETTSTQTHTSFTQEISSKETARKTTNFSPKKLTSTAIAIAKKELPKQAHQEADNPSMASPSSKDKPLIRFGSTEKESSKQAHVPSKENRGMMQEEENAHMALTGDLTGKADNKKPSNPLAHTTKREKIPKVIAENSPIQTTALSVPLHVMPLKDIQPFEQGKTSLFTMGEEEEKPVFVKSHYWTLGAFIGLNQNKQNIKLDPSFNQELGYKRTNQEKELTGYNAGLEAIYHFNEHLSIASGLEYHQYLQKINYTGISREELLITDNSYAEYTSHSFWQGGWVKIDGQLVYIENATYIVEVDTQLFPDFDTSTVSINDKTIEQLNGQNSISYIEVPLQLGYSLPFKQVQLQAQAGISIGYLQRVQTKYAVDALDPLNQESVVHNSIVSTGLLKLSILYAVGNRSKLFIQTAYRQQVGNSTEVQGKFTQSLRSYNLNAGFRFDL